MPSDKAIETAKVAAIAAASRKDPYRVLRVDTDILGAAISAAYAIDGDFNDGVEAAKATVVRYRASVVNLAGEYDDKIITAVKDGVVGVLDQMLSDLENLKR